MTAAAAPESNPAGADAADVIATPSRSYRLKWCTFALALLAGAGWFAYDGWVKWPAANEHALRPKEQGGLGLDVPPHPGWDIPMQRVISIALVPLGLLVFGWCMYQSRGQYRLAGNTLHVPGHPPVPMDAIRTIDKRRWDRKGIAIIEYDRPGGGGTGRLKLDDFVYEREPTDHILERIEARVLPPGEQVDQAPDEEKPVEERVTE